MEFIIITLAVTPRSGRAEFTTDKSGRIKCFLKSAPQKGKANKELVKLLAKSLGIAQADVEIVSGQISRTKRIRIATDMTKDQLMDRLGLARQTSLV